MVPPWIAVGFQECNVPVFFVEVAAKSFISRRCSNFIFSRPHKLFRRAVCRLLVSLRRSCLRTA